MPDPLLRSFDRLEDATAARNELLAAGIAASAVQVEAMEDEAAPEKGSFAVGNGLTENSSRARFRAVAPGTDNLYEANFGNTRSPGRNLVIVAVADEGQRQQVAAILDRFGAVDVDPASASAGAIGVRRPR